MSITRSPQNGLVTGSALGSVTDSVSYNGFGEATSYAASFGSSNLLTELYTRDEIGRIAEKVETTSDGDTHTYDYTYDPAGRLITVTRDGSLFSTYGYDGNGNRLTGPGSASGMYDDQDRLQTYGNASYTYTANGELASKTDSTGTSSYHYDVLGSLLSVTLPNATQIDYVVDGRNRRVGKKVNGNLVQGFLYNGQLQVAAELDGAGNVVSRFVYGTKSNVPDYMLRGGNTYRIISDNLGSPRVVVDAASGAIVERVDYDEFGQILATSAGIGFLPFGFAGGLYDADTSLVRFGARDYDPMTGRWTAKDPVLFSGGDTNLYGYVLNDPINRIDPEGLGDVVPGPTGPRIRPDWMLPPKAGGADVVPLFPPPGEPIPWIPIEPFLPIIPPGAYCAAFPGQNGCPPAPDQICGAK